MEGVAEAPSLTLPGGLLLCFLSVGVLDCGVGLLLTVGVLERGVGLLLTVGVLERGVGLLLTVGVLERGVGLLLTVGVLERGVGLLLTVGVLERAVDATFFPTSTGNLRPTSTTTGDLPGVLIGELLTFWGVGGVAGVTGVVGIWNSLMRSTAVLGGVLSWEERCFLLLWWEDLCDFLFELLDDFSVSVVSKFG